MPNNDPPVLPEFPNKLCVGLLLDWLVWFNGLRKGLLLFTNESPLFWSLFPGILDLNKESDSLEEKILEQSKEKAALEQILFSKQEALKKEKEQKEIILKEQEVGLFVMWI